MNRYIVVSGATKSITCSEDNLINKRKYYGLVTYGNGQQLMAKYIGNVGGLNDVIYIPGCNMDILSADSLGRQTGCQVTFDSENGSVSLIKKLEDNYAEIIIGERCTDGLYRTFDNFNISDLRNENSFILLAQEDISLKRTARQELLHNNLWKQLHIKLGHASITRIHSMRKEKCMEGIFIPNSMPTEFYCEACALGKAQKTPKPKIIEQESNREIESFEKIYSDIGGPLIKSLGAGYRFYVLFIDKRTRFKWIYFLHSKSELKEKFRLFQNKVRLEFGRSIGILKSDRGGEYLDGDFSMYLNSCGIIHETTAPYSQWQNGVAERANRTIKDMTRTMLIGAKLPASLWPYAMETAIYISNRLPSSSLPDNNSPYQLLYNRKPNVKNIHPFGCDVYIRIDDSLRTDMEPKSNLRYYLGPNSEHGDSFHIINPTTKRIGLSRDGYKFDDNMLTVFLQVMDPSNASLTSVGEGANAIPELTDVMQLTNFQFTFETVCNSYNVWDIISGAEQKPEINPLEPGITAAERKSREAILHDFNNRSNLAIRFLTKAVKNNVDLISALANDSTPNLTKKSGNLLSSYLCPCSSELFTFH